MRDRRRLATRPLRLRLAAPLLVAWAGVAAGPAALAATPLTVVELFTSQGCSACPAADAALGELAQRDEVLALSEHVDYWDYLGWPDPFSSPTHTLRQRDYARALGLKYVYTPQVVVQGRSQVPGTDRAALAAAVAAAPQLPIGMALQWSAPETLLIRLTRPPEADRPVGVWVVVYDRSRSTPVGSGENSGRTVTNHNVVRDFRRVGTWPAGGDTLTVEASVGDWATSGCAVILQVDGGGPLVAAQRCQPRA